LKQSVQNATYEQKDPLLIYKFESFNLFKQMMDKVNKDIVSFLMKANLPSQDPSQVKREHHQKENLQTSRAGIESNRSSNQSVPQQASQKIKPIVVEKETGRNEKVTITNGSETKEIKWKKAKPLIDSGQWRRV